MLARIRLLILVVPFVGIPSLGHAQEGALPAPLRGDAPAAASAGPRRDLSAVAVRQLVQNADSAVMQRARRQNVGRPVALMVVGGAAIVLGAVIGDEAGTLFMIGGAVALLVGLYQYLQ